MIKTSIDLCVDKQIVVFFHNGILLGNKEEQIAEPSTDVDASQNIILGISHVRRLARRTTFCMISFT